MKKLSSVFVSALASATMFSSALFAQETKKVVLLEQYTGAWCGWCVEGTTFMNDLEKEYGDRFIGVKIHQGDDMQNNAVWSAYNTSVSGFPSGSVDRANINGSLVIPRGAWKSTVGQRMQEEPSVDVKIKSMSYDVNTRELKLTVTSKILMDITDNLRFNVYIVEDSVSGSGRGYDQQNYLSGDTRFKDNEYFSKPKVITGYQHMAVVREMLGGVLGSENSFPSSPNVGETYEYSYTYKVPVTFKAWNTKAIATVYRFGGSMGASEILNACESEVLTKLPGMFLDGVLTSVNSEITSNNENKRTVKVVNNSNDELQVDLDIYNKSELPKEWNCTLKETSVSVPAKSTREVEININANNFAACSRIVVSALPRKEGYDAVGKLTEMWLLTDNAKYAIFYGKSGNNTINAAYQYWAKNNEYASKTVFVPSSANIIKDMPLLGNLEVGVFNMGQNPIDVQDVEGTELDVISKLLENNKKVFISGEAILTFAKGNGGNSPECITEELTNFFESKLYLSLSSSTLKRMVSSSNQLISFALQGIQGDYISNGFKKTCNNSPSSYSEYTETLSLTEFEKNTKPIFNYNNNEDDIAGIRWEDGEKRIVFLGFDPAALAQASDRNNLFERSYNWLLNGSTTSAEELDNVFASAFATPNPISGSNVTLSFDATVDGSITFTVMNTLGQSVMTFDGNVQNGRNNVNLNINNLTSGSYTVSAIIAGRTLRIPFVVAK